MVGELERVVGELERVVGELERVVGELERVVSKYVQHINYNAVATVIAKISYFVSASYMEGKSTKIY